MEFESMEIFDGMDLFILCLLVLNAWFVFDIGTPTNLLI